MLTPWPDYPNATWIQSPGLGGALESDVAYDGTNLYGAWFNSAPIVYKMDNSTQYATTVKTLNWPDNTTVTAVNANTGKPVWSRFFNNFVFRGGMTVTNGMLIIPTGNGTIYFLSTKDGSTISKLYDGSPMFSDPTIGQAANGQWVMLQILGGGRWLAVGICGSDADPAGRADGVHDRDGRRSGHHDGVDHGDSRSKQPAAQLHRIRRRDVRHNRHSGEPGDPRS